MRANYFELLKPRLWDLRHYLKQLCLCPANYLHNRTYRTIYSRLCDSRQANTAITSLVGGDAPFMISRLGSVESRLCYEYAFKSSQYSRITFKQCHNNAGIFPPTYQQLNTVADIYINSLSNIDVLGFWRSPGQHETVNKFCQQSILVDLIDLEPWRALASDLLPWSSLLEDKSVLVVHPFVDSISNQYLFRSSIFPGTQVLPRFKLIPIRPPVTHCGLSDGYTSWSDAFRSLEDRILSQSFDVALLGCGSYGLPLASSIKQHGGQAIHLGGSLQILFGILGRRWENDQLITSLVNSKWTRPLSSERPIGASSIDGGSYW